jgi:rRNA-processing protein FCF1
VRTNPTLTVLLDTSFLLVMIEQRRDVDEELRDLVMGPFQIAILDLVKLELQRLGRTRSSKIGGFANAALELMKARRYSTLPSGMQSSDTDAGILSFSLARTGPLAVATVDRKLRAALSSLGISTVYPKRRRGLLMLKPVRPSST